MSKTNNLTPDLPYKICTHCIMDSTDPNIKFDDRGWCDYCSNFESIIKEKGLQYLFSLGVLLVVSEEISVQREERDQLFKNI